MKHFLLLLCLLTLRAAAGAQNFKADQRKQERLIEAAHKKGRVTDVEYYKLLKEQDAIKYAIEKYAADGVWTPHEKNVVDEKLARAEKRLRRYKRNGEVY